MLPADLPTDWESGQIISPNGEEAGLSMRHGYNYLCEQVNKTQQAANLLVDTKASCDAPVFTGSISMGRKQSETTGEASTTLGKDCVAEGKHSVSVGLSTWGRGDSSMATGRFGYVSPNGTNGLVAGECCIYAEERQLFMVKEHNLQSLTIAPDFFGYENELLSELTTGQEIYLCSHTTGWFASTIQAIDIEAGILTLQEPLVEEDVIRWILLKKENPETTLSSSAAIGRCCVATGNASIATGHCTQAAKNYSFAHGYESKAMGDGAIALGYRCQAIAGYSYAEGKQCITKGKYGHAEGFGSQVEEGAVDGHAEGYGSISAATDSHAEGYKTTASAVQSHAEGMQSVASGKASHVEGTQTTASASQAHAEGYMGIASGKASHTENTCCQALGEDSHTSGFYTVANSMQFVLGRYNTIMTGASHTANNAFNLFIIGNGTSTARSNAFRIQSNGVVQAQGAYNTGGADYAEMFEWADGNPQNEDRRGRFVTLEGNKIRLAQPEDSYVLGIVSAYPAIVGNQFADTWKDMYERDIFGAPVMEQADGIWQEKINPAYNPEQAYISRSDRPEWSAVGWSGQLVTIDDGTCQVNGYAQVASQGTATIANGATDYRVIQRRDETHVVLLVR